MSGDGYRSARFRDEIFERFDRFVNDLAAKKKNRRITQSDALDELLRKAGY